MTHLDLRDRDLTVERMLIRGGFNRDTLMAINTVIKSRMTTQRPAADRRPAMTSPKTVAA